MINFINEDSFLRCGYNMRGVAINGHFEVFNTDCQGISFLLNTRAISLPAFFQIARDIYFQ